MAQDLGGPITELEILEAIGSMHSSKSLGEDGFTTEFYRVFRSSLTPILAALYNDSFKLGSFPQTITEAAISLILQKHRGPGTPTVRKLQLSLVLKQMGTF